jgi:hypothetical protein
MRWPVVMLVALAGLVLPAGLALGVYLASAGTLADPLEVAPLAVQTIAEPSEAAKKKAKAKATRPEPPATTTVENDDGVTVEDDHRGAGDERENDDRSGNSGSGSDDSGSGSDSSGSGSDDSGSGSDSSGSGSGGDD